MKEFMLSTQCLKIFLFILGTFIKSFKKLHVYLAMSGLTQTRISIARQTARSTKWTDIVAARSALLNKIDWLVCVLLHLKKSVGVAKKKNNKNDTKKYNYMR